MRLVDELHQFLAAHLLLSSQPVGVDSSAATVVTVVMFEEISNSCEVEISVCFVVSWVVSKPHRTHVHFQGSSGSNAVFLTSNKGAATHFKYADQLQGEGHELETHRKG